MSIITFPTALEASRMSWAPLRLDISFESVFGSQSAEIAVPPWVVSISAPPQKDQTSGVWQALIMKLEGRKNQLEAWHLARPAPLGTMRGTMTLNAAAAQGATSLEIVASGQTSKTLLQGDLIGLGSGTTQQVVMVSDDATSNGSGVITVNTKPALRNAFAAGAAVTWDKPKALFRLRQSPAPWDYTPGVIVTGFALDLIEDWRA